MTVKRYEQAVNHLARRFGLQVSRIASRDLRLPIEATAEDRKLIESLRPYTMTSAERLWSLIEAVRYIVHEDIPGDFVECGVWRGGSVMAMALELSRLGVLDRRIWLYDTFSGMTTPSDLDIEASTGASAQSLLTQTPVGDGSNIWCVAGRDDVEANLRTTHYPMSHFVIVEGDVVRTLHESIPEKIALLRLDTDWFESTDASLKHLYPRLVPGGVCILDDYGHWKGARHAVDEYFARAGHRPFMHPIDYSGRIFIKTQVPPREATHG